jgi:hypothetical protein
VEPDAIDNLVGRELESIRVNGAISADEARAEVRATYYRGLS